MRICSVGGSSKSKLSSVIRLVICAPRLRQCSQSWRYAADIWCELHTIWWLPGHSTILSSLSCSRAASIDECESMKSDSFQWSLLSQSIDISKKDKVLITALKPREVVASLDKFIVGQLDAKKAVAIALRNRWRRHQMSDDLKNEVQGREMGYARFVRLSDWWTLSFWTMKFSWEHCIQIQFNPASADVFSMAKLFLNYSSPLVPNIAKRWLVSVELHENHLRGRLEVILKTNEHYTFSLGDPKEHSHDWSYRYVE